MAKQSFIKYVTIMMILFFLITSISPLLQASNHKYIEGFTKGVSYKPVVPLEKVTFVQSDEQSHLDDYAYLAAVPTAVFKSDDQLYSHPLLFFEDTVYSDEKKLTLNARTGIDYFMEDWMGFCDERLDEIMLLNVDKKKLDVSWHADRYTQINYDNPYDIAADLALHDWSYSKEAVIAVIDEDFSDEKIIIENKIDGKIRSADINDEYQFILQQTNSLNPVFKDFFVPDEYTFLQAETWWDCIIFGSRIMAPTGDPDIQLYCEYDNDWMQTAAASYWNIYQPLGREFTQSYVYQPGSWRVGITDLPTEGEIPQKSYLGNKITVQGSLLKALKKDVTYYVDITMYPGTVVRLEDTPPFGCKDATFTLSWDDSSVDLGFSIIGPGGEAIFTSMNQTQNGINTIHLSSLGECLEDEYYEVSVFSMQDLSSDLSFTIDYEWKQKITNNTRDALSSATQGSVLASMKNVPLLYVSSDSVPTATMETLQTLGVKKIHLIDIGSHFSKSFSDYFSYNPTIKPYLSETEIFDLIQKQSESDDIVFSTLDPWTYWYLGELQPGGDTDAALFIGPAAYLAAHHGTPVLLVENHPELSSAVVWHNEFWQRFSDDRYYHIPSTAEMVLTGRRIYSFLEKNGFDKEGEENIITVADQYDIGIPWDRIFPGVAHAGRICGSPTDTSYWISRNVFYPVLIYENPALTQDVSLVNGSKSYRESAGDFTWRSLLPFGLFFKDPLFSIKLGLFHITEKSEKESFQNPVLCSFVVHRHRFNERASKYYGTMYQCADGLIPGESASMNQIDMGAIEKYTGKTGSYFPDMTESEVIPFYLEKGGYDSVFSTNLSSVIENLNSGVILWFHIAHGNEKNGGSAEFWDPIDGFKKSSILNTLANIADNLRSRRVLSRFYAFPFEVFDESNPWRGYEWYYGSTDEPDTMTMDLEGMLPFTNIKIPLLPALGQDWVLAQKPFREVLNNIIPFIDPFYTDNLHDGVIATAFYSRLQNSFKEALSLEEKLGNIHSASFITSMCQTSNTYLHLMLIRHGSVVQIQDPWPTSWYGAVWRQSIPRDLILGSTIGEAYSNGISHVGPLYISTPPQWWWDTAENVVLFGDPTLRIYTPDTTYSENNNWDKPSTMHYDKDTDIIGHTPFGATSYPNESINLFNQMYFFSLFFILIIGIIIIIIILGRSGKNEKYK